MDEDSSEDANSDSFMILWDLEHTCDVFGSAAGMLFCVYTDSGNSEKELY